MCVLQRFGDHFSRVHLWNRPCWIQTAFHVSNVLRGQPKRAITLAAAYNVHEHHNNFESTAAFHSNTPATLKRTLHLFQALQRNAPCWIFIMMAEGARPSDDRAAMRAFSARVILESNGLHS